MTMPNGLRAGALALGLLAAAGAATMAEAKTFRLAINADASTLDPHAQNSQVNFAILLQAYEPLVGRDKDLKPVPVLATRWEAVEPMRWRFFLRPGVKFHDGAALTADDVVFSYRRALERTSNVTIYIDSVAGIEKVDDLTVDITTKYPDAVLPEKMSRIFVMNRAWAEANDGTRTSSNANTVRRRIDTPGRPAMRGGGTAGGAYATPPAHNTASAVPSPREPLPVCGGSAP